MKKAPLLFILLWTLSIHSSQAQTTISGVTLPGTIKAGNTTMLLNGGGTRVKFFMDIYVAGLYLSTKGNNGDIIAKANEAMAVRLHIVSGLVTSEKMMDAIKEGFKKSTGDKLAPLQARIDKFVKAFATEPIVKGNEFDISYTPTDGVKITKAGKELVAIEGLDFKTALWGIWLGNEPVDKGLKAGMLGIKE